MLAKETSRATAPVDVSLLQDPLQSSNCQPGVGSGHSQAFVCKQIATILTLIKRDQRLPNAECACIHAHTDAPTGRQFPLD